MSTFDSEIATRQSSRHTPCAVRQKPTALEYEFASDTDGRMAHRSRRPFYTGRTAQGLCLLLCLLPAAGGEARAANSWVKVDEGKTGVRSGSALLWASDLKQLLLVGPAEGAPFVQAFDPAAPAWRPWTSAAPAATKDFSPYYQAAYDPAGQTVYCLSGGPILYSFRVAEKAWKAHAAAVELEGLSWHTMACDPVGRKLVVVGADKKADNLGWSRTVVYDIPSGKWSRLEVAGERVVHVHRQRVAATEACIDLAGRIRLAWYRDPKGAASPQEVAALLGRCTAFERLPLMYEFSAQTQAVTALVRQQKLLAALKAVRALQRQIEEAAEAQYPVPCAAQLAAGLRREEPRLRALRRGP